MFRTGTEKPERERLLLNRRSLETSPPELRQPLAYVLHLRSYWKPDGRAKLIVPTSWMEFLAFGDDNCGVDCVVDRCCPFRNVRFDAETRLVAPSEELPRDTVSQILTDYGMDDCLATFIPRAFEGIPRTRLMSDIPATRHFSQSTPRRIDFALVPGHGSNDTENIPLESDTRCLLLGKREPAETQHSHSTSFDPRTLASSIPEELTSQGQFHLTHLASLIKRGAVGTTTKSFPEWLVLFGLIYDAHRVRVVAYVPHPSRRTLDVIECAVYIVDELSFRSVAGVPTCGLALERLRLVLALTTLRRHVHHLSKSLFSAIDDIGQTNINIPSFLGCSAHDQRHSDDSESLYRCASLGSSQHCSSEYSTCPSSVRAHEPNDDPVLECGKEFSSSRRSFTSSFCSTCLSSLESGSTSDSLDSEDSKNTNSDYMEPSTISLSQGGNKSVPCPNKLSETKRQEIVAWGRQVIPTEHPVKDTYQMVICHPHLKRQRVANFISGGYPRKITGGGS